SCGRSWLASVFGSQITSPCFDEIGAVAATVGMRRGHFHLQGMKISFSRLFISVTVSPPHASLERRIEMEVCAPMPSVIDRTLCFEFDAIYNTDAFLMVAAIPIQRSSVVGQILAISQIIDALGGLLGDRESDRMPVAAFAAR